YAAATPIGPQKVPMMNARLRRSAAMSEYQKFRTVFPQVIMTRWRGLAGQSKAASAKSLKIGADAIHFSPKSARTKGSEKMARYVARGITANDSMETIFPRYFEYRAGSVCKALRVGWATVSTGE